MYVQCMYGERERERERPNHAILYIESKYSIPFSTQFFYDFQKSRGFGSKSTLLSIHVVCGYGKTFLNTCSLPFFNLYYRQT
mgnify:CR=1 FL=1